MDVNSKFISEYSDPLSIATNVIEEVTKLGGKLENGIQPIKLKQGFGVEVCIILNTIVDLVLAAKSLSLKQTSFPKSKAAIKSETIINEVEEEVGSVHLDESEDWFENLATEDIYNQT